MISCVFSKQYRLRTNGEFATVFQNSKRFSAGMLTVLCKRNALPYPRLGMSIGRKRIRRAVDRNVIKRAMRETFRHNREVVDGIDIVLVTGKMPKNVNRVEINECLEILFKQLVKYYAKP